MTAAIEQQTLWGPELPDPGRPAAQAHRGAGPTEVEAAARFSLRAGSVRQLLLQRLAQVGDHGLTGSEAVAWLQSLGRPAKETSVRPRLPELVHDGWAEHAAATRRTSGTAPAEVVYAITGRGAAVWSAWQATAAEIR